MYEKQYRKISEGQTLSQEIEEQKNKITAINRVKNGKATKSDFKIIQKERERYQLKDKGVVKLSKTLEKEVTLLTNEMTNRNQKLKKITGERNRLRRLRRLQIEKEKREGIMNER